MSMLHAAIVFVGLLVTGPKPFPTNTWDVMLQQHVDLDGRVAYSRIDRLGLDSLVAALAESGPKSAPELYRTRNDRLAYFLNAYNIVVWKNVVLRLPKLTSVLEDKSFFNVAQFQLGGEVYTLQTLEADIRKQFGDPRVHMALNCASAGCPKLPRYAFTSASLERQLAMEAKRFCDEKRNVSYDAGTKTVKLSKIFEWYKDDFGTAPTKILGWINDHRTEKIPVDATVVYTEYDWKLNDLSLKR